MASFFQPGLQDPVRQECEGSSTFQVYCNSVLPSALTFKHTYQLVILVLGATCVVVPIVFYFTHLLFQKRISLSLPTRAKPTSNTKNGDKDSILSAKKGAPSNEPKFNHLGVDAAVLSRPLLKRPDTPSFRSSKSFCLYSNAEDSRVQESSKSHDLIIIPFKLGDDSTGSLSGSYSVNSSRTTLNEIPTVKMTLARIRMEDFGLEESHLVEAAQSLAMAQMLNGWAGYTLECTTTHTAQDTNYFLACLASLEVPVILSCQHDCEAIDHVDLSLASGVILENACILPSGERRDYFKSRRLRDTMARCSVQRDKRPEFFVGFLDLWESRPKPSVVRRAAKIAQHFDAVMEHGPIDGANASSLVSSSKTMSAFEYLRRSEMIEVSDNTNPRYISLADTSKVTEILDVWRAQDMCFE